MKNNLWVVLLGIAFILACAGLSGFLTLASLTVQMGVAIAAVIFLLAAMIVGGLDIPKWWGM